jgi:hypothetical protein
MFSYDPPASAMEISAGGKTLDEVRKRKMMRWRKIVMKELGFFTLAKHALFISTPYWASAETRSKVHLWAFIFFPEQTIRKKQRIKSKDTCKN